MKATATKALIYDNTCPVCKLYSSGFVKYGFLEKENRIAFSHLDRQEFVCRMDLQRSRHEIPLVDLQSGETIYGLDALLFLLAQKWPATRILNKTPFYWFFKRLYALVSYNRRIIAASEKQEIKFDCTPDFNMKYRVVFIAFAVLFSSLVTWWFGVSAAHYLDADNGGCKMLLIAGSGWCLQMMLAFLFMKKKRIDYCGHIAALMMTGVLILVPGILAAALTQYHYPAIPLLSVCISSITMLWQHIKRVKILQVSQAWTLLWFLSLQGTAVFWAMRFY